MLHKLMRSGLLACLITCLVAGGAGAQEPTPDLSHASMEELTLMQISVSSFARRDEDLWTTPAAVFVITREDIARSAATSIPELLRIVPGMQVAQINASRWAVSARGFNSAYADKLLVLVDGRTVYSEIYSGVPWDQVDMPLGDIEQIEVIRGPGAAVWGTNAVNGVVNIITRRAHSTLGSRVAAHVGRINESIDLRYGGSLGDRAQYRGVVSFINREPLETITGAKAYDGETMARGGGRIDWQRSWADWITVTGDLYGGKAKEEVLTVLAVPVQHNGDDSGSIAGGHILGRWEHTLAGEDTALQVYYDDQSRFELTNHSRTRTEDIDFQDHVVGRHNDIVWGSELRFSQDEIRGVVQATIQPLYRNYLADGFLQDEITLVPHRLTATVGSKIQDGTLAGFQIQPSARIFWAIQPNRTAVWGAVSLAAVSPAIQEKGLHLPLALGTVSGLPLIGTIKGSQAYKDEEVLAYEAGFRRRFAYHFVFDMATFINRYRRLESLTSSTPQFEPTPAPHIDMDFVYSNAYRAQSQGIESSLGWKPKPNLTFQASYSWMQSNSQQVTPGNITQIDSWATPRNNLGVSGSWNITSQWSVDSSLYNVGALATGASFGLRSDPGTVAPAYTRLDLHVVRKVGRSLEFAAGGTNLLTPRHLEFGNGTDFVTPEYVPRSIFVNASWSF